LHIPLLIFPPGHQEGRIDIFDRTSAVDVLPTLLHLTGQPVSPSLPGMVLPPFNPGYQGMTRDIFSMNPRHSQPDKKMKEGTLSVLKDNYKLTYHFGHEEMEDTPEYYELYDLVNDPEELVNLFDEQPEISQALKQILFEQFEKAEAPYG
jgi:arylsulfatase A-like enzyme